MWPSRILIRDVFLNEQRNKVTIANLCPDLSLHRANRWTKEVQMFLYSTCSGVSIRPSLQNLSTHWIVAHKLALPQ